PITVGFSTGPGLVEVWGAAGHGGIRRPLQLAAVSELIVDAVSDEVELADGPAGVRLSLVERPGRTGRWGLWWRCASAAPGGGAGAAQGSGAGRLSARAARGTTPTSAASGATSAPQTRASTRGSAPTAAPGIAACVTSSSRTTHPSLTSLPAGSRTAASRAT